MTSDFASFRSPQKRKRTDGKSIIRVFKRSFFFSNKEVVTMDSWYNTHIPVCARDEQNRLTQTSRNE